MKFTNVRWQATLAVVACLLLVAACSNNEDPETNNTNGATSTEGVEPITLTVDVFGEQGFGYDALYEQYTEQNPHVTIEQRGSGLGLGDYNERLLQWLTAGEGAGDIVALEEGTIVQFYNQTDQFVDLAGYGADELSGNFLDWKWNQGAPGGFVLGLGTDIGSMALCYRSDVLAEAGLPTDRDDLAERLETWDDYVQLGEEFVAADTGKSFLDAATNIYNVLLMQTAGNNSGHTYYDTDNNLDFDNPDIRTAWDLTVEMIDAGLSANLQSFSDEWNAGFQSGSFATLACPAWMTGVIQGAAGDAAAGLWDITSLPGGGGNWGGSFLAVPTQSQHPEEAAKLAMFLTSPEAQVVAFEALGNLPSSPQALEDEAVLAAANAYFNDAPTGEIFGAGAGDLQPVYLGPKNNAVRETGFEDALRSIEQGLRTPEEAWTAALEEGERAGR